MTKKWSKLLVCGNCANSAYCVVLLLLFQLLLFVVALSLWQPFGWSLVLFYKDVCSVKALPY